jgi:hypothetical protein
MCGPTPEQQEIQQDQIDFYNQGIQESKTAFAESQALQQGLKSVYDPILKAGPNQMGFSQDELDVLNASAVEGTAENYKQASDALTAKLGAQGGGNIPGGPTGSQEQLEAELSQSSAEEQSREQTQILESGYQQGNNEFNQASNVEGEIAGQLNPTAFEGAATSAGGAASTTANEVAQEQDSWVNAALGAAGSLGSAVIGENPKGIFG